MSHEQLIPFVGELTIEAAAGPDGQPRKGPRRFSMMAYGGGPIRVRNYDVPVVVDLAGLTGRTAKLPIYFGHDNGADGSRLLGHSDTIDKANGKLTIAGAFSASNDFTRQVLEAADNGYAWQTSIGAVPDPSRMVEVRAGETVNVNGREITGPAVIARKSVLRHVAVLPEGADATTTLQIAAKLHKDTTKMTFDEWLEQNGLEAHTHAGRATLETLYQRTTNGQQIDAGPDVHKAYELLTAAAGTIGDERERQIREGIKAGWSVDKTEKELLRAQLAHSRVQQAITDRPMAAAHGGHGPASTPETLEAAFLIHLGYEALGEKTLTAAAMEQGRAIRATHILDIFKTGLQMEGLPVPSSRDGMIRASFSTHTITTMLTTTGNKLLQNAFQAFPSVARIVAKKLSAGDFKAHTGYRMTADLNFEQIGAANEIPHGTLGQSSFSYSVKTFAKMLTLSRTDIVNDDLGAFAQIPELQGRGAASTLEHEFWKLVLANVSDFFGSGNANYISGGTSALGIAGLGLAVTKMRQFVDSAGTPLSVQPQFLVCPPELESVADQLFASTNLLVVPDATANATTSQPDGNPFKNKYRPLVVPHLSNSSYSGYSTTAWYLFGNPADVAGFGIAYLDGVEWPTIQTADADFSTLGMSFRGYLDFGVCQIDSKGGVKSAGT